MKLRDDKLTFSSRGNFHHHSTLPRSLFVLIQAVSNQMGDGDYSCKCRRKVRIKNKRAYQRAMRTAPASRAAAEAADTPTMALSELAADDEPLLLPLLPLLELLEPAESEGVEVTTALLAEGTGKLPPPNTPLAVAWDANEEAPFGIGKPPPAAPIELELEREVGCGVCDETAPEVTETICASVPFKLAKPILPAPSNTEKTFLRNESPTIH